MLNAEALETLFSKARTYNGWQDRPVDNAQLHHIYELMKWGPTSANCSPMRIVFVRTPEAQQKLLGCLSSGNLEKTRSAPVTAILGMDMAFYEKLPELFPHADARSWFTSNQELTHSTAFRNASLQAGYFMLAARAVGLDCGAMSGFDTDKVDAAFFEGSTIRPNLLCNLGYGDPDSLLPRSPRLSFEQACQIV